MDANTIITMIGSLGFPIVACIGIAYFFAKANDNYRMEREIEELKIVESKFYQRDKDAAVLEVKLKEATASEVLYTVCETMGSLLAGLSSLYWENRGWWILIVGIGLVIGGIVFKIVKK